MVDFNIFGVFCNPQDKQNMNVSLDLYFDEELKEKIRSLEGVRSAACRNCIIEIIALIPGVNLHFYGLWPRYVTKLLES